jgi:ribosomal protein S18 acetylase RimI-like enzyme
MSDKPATVTNAVTKTHRIATRADIPAIIELMGLAIRENMKSFLSAAEIQAAQETMGVDQSLIADGTYFVIETMVPATHNSAGEPVTRLIGCGGWGKRRTLYGGDHTSGRDDSLSDPMTDAARIRAMYTHPDYAREGIGSLLLELGEEAARKAGFRTIELGSTLAGEPLYRARGYREISRETHIAGNGADNVVIKMSKSLMVEAL